MKINCLLIVFALAVCGNPSVAQEVSFTRDIRPILSDKCFACHGNDEETRQADLRLDFRDQAIEMDAIAPGSLDDSNAWQRIISEDENTVMPPPHTHKPLSDSEKAKLRQWIEQGANYETHWSYRPISKPAVTLANPSDSPIDTFIRDTLNRKNLAATKAADRATLIRRLSVDLTGLPPSVDEISAFENDTSDDAYEKLVDRLLDDEAFGERMAVFWLDLVRYADTIGYHSDNPVEVSAYRDYVINAFNANKRFDEFTIEQLAGDLLPDATTEQKIASGYNRLLQTTQEGGAQPKEYIAIYAADRVRNVSGVWLGQTMGCAQCHDHKYDPITAKDFYAMSAFFADIKEVAVGKRKQTLTLYTDEENAALKSLGEKVAAAAKAESEFQNGSELRVKEQAAWEESLLSSENATDIQWLVPKLLNVKVSEGDALKELGDGSLLSVGKIINNRNYSFEFTADQKVAAIRLEALPDDSFTYKTGLSRGNGNFVLTGFEVSHNGKPLKIASAKADYAQPNFPAAHAIDGQKKTGWAISGHVQHQGRRVIVFKLQEPIDLSANQKNKLQVRMLHESVHTRHNIGRFRISIPASEDPEAELDFNGNTRLPGKTGEILKIAKEQRTEEQQTLIDSNFLQQSKTMSELKKRKSELAAETDKIKKGAQTMLATETLPTPRMTKIRNRGDWMDESGEVVQPAVPAFLPSNFKDVDRRLTRLDLANWIVDPSNPLTARTFVNRLWKVFYGRGLSDNLDDLGGQGEPPTHPELLDWLAADFQSDWDVKRVIKSIVMTQTYRQSSVADEALVQADPANQWHARQGRWRLDAEFVRDTALQLSGLLDESQIGGRSVKPYQPEGYWQHLNFPKRKWKADSDAKLYRKSIYTFWCRSFLHPTMLAFDAPTREECVASRARSNIPQQALVLLNDPIFVEAARGFATRMMQTEGSDQQKVSQGWQAAVGRESTEAEIKLLAELLEAQRQRFKESPADASSLLEVGESSIPDGVDVAELAAWTQVARAMLNAYETISRH